MKHLYRRHLGHCALAAFALTGAVFFSEVPAAFAYQCERGQIVDNDTRCSAFDDIDEVIPDDRVTSLLGTDSPVRSFALIVGIDDYSEMPEENLPAAKQDVENLRTFLKEQKFDEIVVLRNAEASKENINYFLQTYFPAQFQLYQGRSRLLFAYSGHGIAKRPGQRASLVLSEARTLSDPAHLLPLDDLFATLGGLRSSQFHVLALINACNAGDAEDLGKRGGNRNVSNKPGGHALTAGAADELVYSIEKDAGSIFFEDLINGIRSGEADRDARDAVLSGPGGEQQKGLGIVRLGAIESYLSLEIEKLNRATGKHYSEPWTFDLGSDVSQGAFFFLFPTIRSTTEKTFSLASGFSSGLTSGPTSVIVGHPEIKVFKQPAVYPVKGIDVSEHNGMINWEVVKASGVDFAYIRATGVQAEDRKFFMNFAKSKAAGLRRGAYHLFSFCQPVEAQIDLLRRTVPETDSEMLPVAIDVEWYRAFGSGIGLASEKRCSLEKGVDGVKKDLARFLAAYRSTFGKTPLVYGNRDVFKWLLDEDSGPYQVWVGLYTPKEHLETKLSGQVPWTLWQYNATDHVAGVPGEVDTNVFFGTVEQFHDFAAGKDAAMRALQGFGGSPQ